jgi:hypothetical protein
MKSDLVDVTVMVKYETAAAVLVAGEAASGNA